MNLTGRFVCAGAPSTELRGRVRGRVRACCGSAAGACSSASCCCFPAFSPGRRGAAQRRGAAAAAGRARPRGAPAKTAVNVRRKAPDCLLSRTHTQPSSPPPPPPPRPRLFLLLSWRTVILLHPPATLMAAGGDEPRTCGRRSTAPRLRSATGPGTGDRGSGSLRGVSRSRSRQTRS